MTPPKPLPPSPEFEASWEAAQPIPGWLTKEQGRLLWDEAERVPEGATLVEIGSHQGRSTLVLALAARTRSARVVAIDPFVDGRLFGGSPTRTKFENNLRSAGIEHLVDLLPEYSTKARPKWDRSFDYLYIDGKHDYWTLSDDLKWAEHLPEGAPVLVHDCFSSIGVTLGVIAHVLPSKRLRYEHREGSLAVFRCGRPSTWDRLRFISELPWWIRNVGIKILLRLRLRGVARLVGHNSPYDPY